jgi:hypothetical protein
VPAGHADLLDSIYGECGEVMRSLASCRPGKLQATGQSEYRTGNQDQTRERSVIGAQGQIHSGEWYASFADEFFREGTLNYEFDSQT